MSFKENILKKIEINGLVDKVLLSFKHQDNSPKIDKAAMQRLLELSRYQYTHKRDLDLYVKAEVSGTERIVVLDNELCLYRTSIDDVVLRKSPTIKEMISIRNAIKILNDSDVVVSKKDATVKTVQMECIDMLDLTCDRSDIEAIASDGRIALEIEDPQEVLECLIIFSELLDYNLPPPGFLVSDHEVRGALVPKENGEILYGPIVIYSSSRNRLKMIAEPISSMDKQKKEFVRHVAMGKEKASAEGPFVFQLLKDAAAEFLFDQR